MRTPNTACLLCAKPLYRRPSEMAKSRYAACMSCRSEAQKVAGITDAQRRGMALGSVKGTNHRTGYTHREESKKKASRSQKAWCAANPDLVALRGEKTRGEKHRLWNGGSSRLNTSIRQMTESRRWMDAVKARDGQCLRCGSVEGLEAHHKRALAVLIADLGISSRDDARQHADILWALDNGETVCAECHYAEHGRIGPPVSRATIFRDCAVCGDRFAVRRGRSMCCGGGCAAKHRGKAKIGAANPNWKGGRIAKACGRCGAVIHLKPAEIAQGKGKFCSLECRYGPR